MDIQSFLVARVAAQAVGGGPGSQPRAVPGDPAAQSTPTQDPFLQLRCPYVLKITSTVPPETVTTSGSLSAIGFCSGLCKAFPPHPGSSSQPPEQGSCLTPSVSPRYPAQGHAQSSTEVTFCAKNLNSLWVLKEVYAPASWRGKVGDTLTQCQPGPGQGPLLG